MLILFPKSIPEKHKSDINNYVQTHGRNSQIGVGFFLLLFIYPVKKLFVFGILSLEKHQPGEDLMLQKNVNSFRKN